MTESSKNDRKQAISNIKGTIFKVLLSKKLSSVHMSKKQYDCYCYQPFHSTVTVDQMKESNVT